jgi:glutamate dehydrogenase/leucine dehydrogenase
MHKEGAKIVGIVERDVGLYNENGMDPDDVKMTMMQGNLSSYSHAEIIETTDP